MYGSGAWTLKVEQQRHLQSTQRRMLRKMAGIGRSPNECWVEHIKRSTHAALDLAQKYGVLDWSSEFQEIKKRTCDKMQSTVDGRWSKRLLEWHPWHQVHAKRHVGGQRKRWNDT